MPCAGLHPDAIAFLNENEVDARLSGATYSDGQEDHPLLVYDLKDGKKAYEYKQHTPWTNPNPIHHTWYLGLRVVDERGEEVQLFRWSKDEM